MMQGVDGFFKYLLSGVFSFALCGALYGAPQAKIHLIDQVYVAAPGVTLGEIATVEGDPGLVRELKNIWISEAPKVDQKGSISSYRLRSMLHTQGFDDIEILGQQSSYFTESRTLSPGDIKARATEWIQSQLPSGTEAELSFQGLFKDWQIPEGEHVEIRFSINGNHFRSSISMCAEALIDGKAFSTNRFRASVKLFREVAVLQKPLQRHEAITEDAVAMERADVTELRGMEIASLDDVLGMMTTRSYPTRHVLKIQDLEKPILVEKGAVTKIYIKNGSISMTIAGAEAMQNGREGELVRFKNPMNPHTTLQARIVDKGVARIVIR